MAFRVDRDTRCVALGNPISHLERTKPDSYLILCSKVTSRWIRAKCQKLQPQGNQKKTWH